ncbi:interleukin-6 receptor subunit beta-like [Pristis pectinata]|uniref:interleukin-6 receptor subunit beta-like n=1 Tax=Pristis pectinata TaxID=685728 RepID=UPI00223E6BF1|nr:interleukin-6 receptor subunit beta-like [Pristis pectinata]
MPQNSYDKNSLDLSTMFSTEKAVSVWAWVMFSISSFIVEGGLSMLCHDVDSTSKVVKLQSSLSLTCALRRECIESLDANASHIFWKLNDTKIPQEQYRFNETVSRVTLKHFDAVKGYLTCHINIKGAPNILHRFTIKAGLPPEKPKNISCVSYLEKNFTCFWDQGHETYLETNFTLIRIIEHFGNDTCVNTRKNTCSFFFPAVYVVDCKIIVMAENALGKAWSDPLDLKIRQTFRTGPPRNVAVHSVRGQGSSLLVTWQDPTELAPFIVLLYNIQYQMVGTSKWIQVTEKEEIINNSFVIKNLKPFTSYTVAVRCIGKEQTIWSDWSNKGTGLTSEAKPLIAPELWRQIKNLDSQGIREVHLQWKALNKSKANGIILGYRIWSEKRWDQMMRQQDNTTSLNYSLLLTHEAHVVTVVAYNSVGDSPKAVLIVPAINHTAPTTIQYVQVTSQNNRLLAEWKTSERPDNGYIVEWCLFLDTSPCAGPLHWQYEGNTTEMAYLQGDLKPFVCYNISVYAVYNDGPGNPCSTLAYLQQSYPTEGPSAAAHKIKGTEAVIKWQEIPVEKRRGFITHYTIFYESVKGKNAVTLKPNVCEYTLKSLQKNTKYFVHVMASTVKGGKNSSSIFFKTNAIEQEDIVIIVMPSVLCFLLVIIVSVACFNNQHWIKKYLWPEVADPAGSSMADWLQKHPSKNVHVLKVLNLGNDFTSEFSTVEVLRLSEEDKLKFAWKDKTSSLYASEEECSPDLSPQQQDITNGAEVARLLQPTDIVTYTVLEESYKSQVPDNRLLPEQPLSSTIPEASAGDQVNGQNTCDGEEENWWQPNTNENDLLQQIIKDSPYLKNSLNVRELPNAPDPDDSINSGVGSCSEVDVAMPGDTGTLDQNQYNAQLNNHPVKPVQTYITLELLGLRLNKGM